jgi:DNA-binding response OmpR family regulator
MIGSAMTNASFTTPQRRVLVVEDEFATRQLLRTHLALAGFQVEENSDGASALEQTRQTKYDLILLEVMLPGLDGITLCRAIRNHGVNMGAGILMVTARDTESDKVLGLESGADDYLTKPFGIRELIARGGAILRRNARFNESADAPATRLLRSRDVTLDAEKRHVLVRGESVDLTKQEFDLLYLLAARPGIVFSRSALLAKIWTGETSVTERTVDTVVSRLRRKIEHDAQRPCLILTAWGVGYKFVEVD